MEPAFTKAGCRKGGEQLPKIENKAEYKKTTNDTKAEEFGCETEDYIFFTNDKFSIDSVLSIPEHTELGENLLPDWKHPSDHLHIQADLVYVGKSTTGSPSIEDHSRQGKCVGCTTCPAKYKGEFLDKCRFSKKPLLESNGNKIILKEFMALAKAKGIKTTFYTTKQKLQKIFQEAKTGNSITNQEAFEKAYKSLEEMPVEITVDSLNEKHIKMGGAQKPQGSIGKLYKAGKIKIGTTVICKEQMYKWTGRRTKKIIRALGQRGTVKEIQTQSKNVLVAWDAYNGKTKISAFEAWIPSTCEVMVEQRRRRMAQREFSDRRDSPVMVKLLQDIIDAQDD